MMGFIMKVKYLSSENLKDFLIKTDYILSPNKLYKRRVYKVFYNQSFVLDFKLKRDAIKFIREKAR